MKPFKETKVATEPSDRTRVLHITESLDAECAALTTALQDGGAEVEMCADVYRGLARLGRSAERQFHAVLLNLDRLPREEYGFVSEVVRRDLPVPIFVYGGLTEAERISEALSLGAKAIIEPTPGAIARVLDEARKGALSAAHETPPPEPGEDAPPAGSRGETEIPFPWREAGERPVRTPPDKGAAEAPGMAGQTGYAAARVPIEDGPLLSAEEIRLLLYNETSPSSKTANTEVTR